MRAIDIVLVFAKPDPAKSVLAAFNMRSAAGLFEVSGLGLDANGSPLSSSGVAQQSSTTTNDPTQDSHCLSN
jgi:hypothetical protein